MKAEEARGGDGQRLGVGGRGTSPALFHFGEKNPTLQILLLFFWTVASIKFNNWSGGCK